MATIRVDGSPSKTISLKPCFVFIFLLGITIRDFYFHYILFFTILTGTLLEDYVWYFCSYFYSYQEKKIKVTLFHFCQTLYPHNSYIS